jgi:PKD repeat protein
VPLSSTLTLAGSAADDGLPDPPGTLTVTWTQVSGPGSTTFDPPGAAQTDATFSSAGTYTLRLTADDSELTDADEVTVTVTPPAPANEAPVVNAGADRSVRLSGTLTLAGSASDDGLPDPPGTLTVTWTQVSGPGSTTFGTPGAAQTTARFSSAGTYILRLTADDSEISASDDVRVTVKP